MTYEEDRIAKKLNVRRILIPILLGLAAASYLLVSNLMEVHYQEVGEGEGTHRWVDSNGNGEVDRELPEEFVRAEEGGAYRKASYKDVLGRVDWGWGASLAILLALLMMLVRDLAYMYRIRVMTDKELSWRQSFDVIMLWEFSSAITPSIVGGSGLAMFIVNREGIRMGRSTAVVMVTAMLDELFYIIMVPTLLLFVGASQLFPESLQNSFFGIEANTVAIFWIGYFFLLFLTLFIVAGVFILPRTIKYWLLRICKLPFLRKWRYKAMETGNDLMISSHELRGKPVSFWLKAFLATVFSWTGRYWVVNFIILAFATSWIPFPEHLLIYTRQLVVWVIMLISPTPGGSGIAEVAFSGFLGELIPLGLTGVMAFLWRLISYYPYLFIGAVIFPRWVRKTGMRIRAAKEGSGGSSRG
jgi:uncharacterized protein (TIRG00374 family)